MAKFISTLISACIILNELIISFATIRYILYYITWHVIGVIDNEYLLTFGYQTIILYSPTILFNSTLFNLIIHIIKKIPCVAYIIHETSDILSLTYIILFVVETMTLFIIVIAFILFVPIFKDPIGWIFLYMHMLTFLKIYIHFRK